MLMWQICSRANCYEFASIRLSLYSLVKQSNISELKKKNKMLSGKMASSLIKKKRLLMAFLALFFTFFFFFLPSK